MPGESLRAEDAIQLFANALREKEGLERLLRDRPELRLSWLRWQGLSGGGLPTHAEELLVKMERCFRTLSRRQRAFIMADLARTNQNLRSETRRPNKGRPREGLPGAPLSL
jgi:hypothetical protein